MITFWGLAKRNTLLLRRYPFDLFFLLVTYYLLFVIVFLGLRVAGGERFTSSGSLSSVVIGLMLWFLVQSSYGDLVNQLTVENTQGTLEQFALSRYGLAGTLCMSFVVDIAVQLLVVSVALFPIMATTGRWLHGDLVTLVPLIVLTIMGVGGLGLALGGLAVVFKRVNAFSQFAVFGFIGLVAAPVDRMPALKALPLALGSWMIRRSMVDGSTLFTLPVADLAVLLATGAGYAILGFAVFRWMDRLARDRGLLGQF